MADTPTPNPSWTYKDDPDLPDLIDVMYRDEREKWYRGGTLAEREELLAKVEKRWRWYREGAKKNPPAGRVDWSDTHLENVRVGLEELHRRLQTGELVDTTVTPLPTKTVPPKTNNGLGLLAIGFAMLERGLDVIGYHNLFVGGGLFLGAFMCFLMWFVRHERARKWRFGVRIAIAFAAALVYFSLIGRQLYRQYATEAAPVPAVTSPTVPQAQNIGQGDSKTFVDVDGNYLVGLYKKYNTAQADEAVKHYIGKWLKVSGTASDVDRVKHSKEPDTAQMTISVHVDKGSTFYAVVAEFDEQRWIDRAIVFSKGEPVTVVGKIERVVDAGIVLHKCEIVE